MPTTQNSSLQKTIAVLIACFVWFTIIFQFFIRTGSAVNFFSFFTVLCNLLVAICLSFSAMPTTSAPARFFSKLSVQSATALYIFVVAVVYNTVLRGLVELSGWGYFLDNMLHVVNPILYILYWAFFRTRGTLQWKDGLVWLLFPLVYLIYSLIRGAIVNWYPYPFLNAQKFGHDKVAINSVVVLAVFLIGGFLVIMVTRSLKKSPN